MKNRYAYKVPTAHLPNPEPSPDIPPTPGELPMPSPENPEPPGREPMPPIEDPKTPDQTPPIKEPPTHELPPKRR